MATDKNNQYLVTGDVDGLLKVWEIIEYATKAVDSPITETPRKIMLYYSKVKKVIKYLFLGFT